MSNYAKLVFTLKNSENVLDARYHLPKSPLEVGRILAASRLEVKHDNLGQCSCGVYRVLLLCMSRMGNYQVHSVGCVACGIVCAPQRCHAPYSSG